VSSSVDCISEDDCFLHRFQELPSAWTAGSYAMVGTPFREHTRFGGV
jgi:hypothetical protein